MQRTGTTDTGLGVVAALLLVLDHGEAGRLGVGGWGAFVSAGVVGAYLNWRATSRQLSPNWSPRRNENLVWVAPLGVGVAVLLSLAFRHSSIFLWSGGAFFIGGAIGGTLRLRLAR